MESCGLCSDAERAVFEPLLGPSEQTVLESAQERSARARFSYAPLGDVVSESNAGEVLSLVARELEWFEAQADGVGGEAQTSMECGTAPKVRHQCEILEVGLTKLLQLLEEVISILSRQRLMPSNSSII